MHGGLYGVGHFVVQAEHRRGVGRDVGVGAAERQRHLDVVGDGAHAEHALGGAFSGEFSRVGVDGAGQRDGAFTGRHADRARIDRRIPVELLHDGVADAEVLIGQGGC